MLRLLQDGVFWPMTEAAVEASTKDAEEVMRGANPVFGLLVGLLVGMPVDAQGLCIGIGGVALGRTLDDRLSSPSSGR